MKRIILNQKEILTIKNSKFIALSFYLAKKEEVKKHLQETKKNYPHATHYCYAYILDQDIKYSDDKEPSNTSGIVIRDYLIKKELNHILVIVVRYFGGIKLGIGGLIKAYTESVKLVIKEDNFRELKNYYQIRLSFPYDKLKEMEYLLKGSIITKKEYHDNIQYECLITDISLLETNHIPYQILNNHYLN